MDEGRIVEGGTHSELLGAGRVYASLHAAQQMTLAAVPCDWLPGRR